MKQFYGRKFVRQATKESGICPYGKRLEAVRRWLLPGGPGKRNIVGTSRVQGCTTSPLQRILVR